MNDHATPAYRSQAPCKTTATGGPVLTNLNWVVIELGGRDRNAMEGHNITKEEFKEHFRRVSQDRYEVEPQEMERTLREVKDLKNTQRAIDTRAEMNETPQEGEIRKAIMETKDSAPGKDCVRISYIREARSLQDGILHV